MNEIQVILLIPMVSTPKYFYIQCEWKRWNRTWSFLVSQL